MDLMKEMRERAQESMRERMSQGLSATKSPREKHEEQPLSLRKAITAKCYECMGDGGEPGWRKLIQECCAIRCPLHSVRPYQKKDDK